MLYRDKLLGIYKYILIYTACQYPTTKFFHFFSLVDLSADSGLNFGLRRMAACHHSHPLPGVPAHARSAWPHAPHLRRRAYFRAGNVPAALPTGPRGSSRERYPCGMILAIRRAALARAWTYIFDYVQSLFVSSWKTSGKLHALRGWPLRRRT